ncbi:MAG: serine/threonine-protein kinase [Vicinamibacterales bacterium]
MTGPADLHSGDDKAPTVDPSPGGQANAGATIGRYRCLQLVGEGGMGEVWRAEQTEPIRRVVAVKLIRPDISTAHVVARFEAERQALAVMDHPAIARVLDGGATPEGRPYFVMEYVAGESITSYCRSARSSVKERVQLFVAVCEGVQHAHQKGIIHRDLKPSNILIATQGDRPAPKIIDFGIAKAVAQPLVQRPLYTEIGAMIGTPEYMSPEQAQLTTVDIDTRSDVYTLGIILYELLTGVLPFDASALREKGIDELRRTVREVDPPKPSTRVRTTPLPGLGVEAATAKTLASELRGDLDWIVLKAIEKDRNRRYGSAAELSADLGRYLRDEPVSASPPSAAYRIGKFVRRNRAAVAAGGLALLLLVAFAATMTVQARRIARARDQAAREAATATQISEFLEGLFAVSDPSEARGNSITAREVLDKGADRIRVELRSEPTVQARLMATIGRVYTSLGLYQAATPLLSDAIDLDTRVAGPSALQTLAAKNTLANAYFYQERHADAARLYEQVVNGRRATLGPDHPDTLRAQYDLASAYNYTNIDEAIRLNEATLAAQRRVLGNEHADTLGSMGNLASMYFSKKMFEPALKLSEEVYELRKRTLGPDHLRTLNALHNVGTNLERLGRNDEAEQAFLDTIAGRSRLLGEHHPITVNTRIALAAMFVEQGRFEEAVPLAIGAYDDLRKAGVVGARLTDAKRLVDELARRPAK